MKYKVTLHRETLGVTQPALKALRDELALRIDHEICVFQVPSQDGDGCDAYGFFLVDKTTNEITIIGDGFRGDNGGEGGKGHRAAQALLAIYGLKPFELPDDAAPYVEDLSLYNGISDIVAELAGAFGFIIAWGKVPRYVDWCFSGRRS